MCAVLEDAVDCFQKQFGRANRRAKHLGREAEQWLFSEDPNWPFSFLSICSVLGLCPEYIRQGLKHGRERGQGPLRQRPAYVMRVQQRRVV